MWDELDLPRRIVIFFGGYGSGKTEISINLAVRLASRGEQVTLVDLDTVTPFFRTRERQEEIEAYGVRVVTPPHAVRSSSLPIPPSGLRYIPEAVKGRVIMDVGGNDLGARVLGSIKDKLVQGEFEALFVVNTQRPFTRDVSSIQSMLRSVEHASNLSATGLVCNTHLGPLTDVSTVTLGLSIVLDAAAEVGKKVRFVSCADTLQDAVRQVVHGVPVLGLRLYMTPPWNRTKGE